MKNIKELRESLCETYDNLIQGKIESKDAKEIANVSGKIMTSIKVELEYAKMNKSKKKITFLEYDNTDEKLNEEMINKS